MKKLLSILSVGVWFFSPLTYSQTVYEPFYVATLAGLTNPAYPDGSGTAARFASPGGAALDSAGNIYVADALNHTIRKVTPDGVVTTLAGKSGSSGSADGAESDARFSSPYGVAVDTAGNVFVADTSNSTIRKITPSGVVTTIAGLAGVSGREDGVGSAARFDHPYGIAVDSNGTLYVADTYNATIRKITPDGAVTTFVGKDETGAPASFSGPFSLIVDAAGVIYVADTFSATIRKITPDAVVTTVAGLAGNFGSDDGVGGAARFDFPWGIAVDSAGSLFVADFNANTLRKITPAGVVSTAGGKAYTAGSDDGIGNASRFYGPIGVAADSAGSVYVVDSTSCLLRKITSGAAVSTLAGGGTGDTDGSGPSARFRWPRKIAVDSHGYVFVADEANHTVRKITPAGVVSTFAGQALIPGSNDGTGTAAHFDFPEGIAVDTLDNVFVSDAGNCTIRKITPAGVVTTFAGSPGVCGPADGVASAARFRQPAGLAIDAAGNLYVADFSANTIRKITPGAVVSTIAGHSGSSGSVDGWGSFARFNHPRAVAIDSAGSVFVVDRNNHTIRRVDPYGFVTTVAGQALTPGTSDGIGAAAGFDLPSGITIDGSNNLYIADANNHLVRKMTPGAVVTTLAGLPKTNGNIDGVGNAARLNAPNDVAFWRGKLYVTDLLNHTIRVGQVLRDASIRKSQGTGAFPLELRLIGAPSIESRNGSGVGNGDHAVVLSFARNLASGQASVSGGTGSVSGTPVIAGDSMSVNVTGVANAQVLTLALSGLSDTDGRAMPDTTFSFAFLLGDVNGDGFVNSADATQVRSRSGQELDATNFLADLNTDGSINSADATIARARSGDYIPERSESPAQLTSRPREVDHR